MDNIKLFDIEFNEKYVETEYIKAFTERASAYLTMGLPVHLRGAAGVGKTSMAFNLAKKIGRPIIFMCGSEEFGNFDLIGGYFGYKKTLVYDNYINSVVRKEEEQKQLWRDGRLVTACKYGYTLIYDEFTRVRPEINNVLLPVLEEKIIDIPDDTSPNSYIKIHPDFRIIFTSNPDEYIGVYKSANALIDRMVTMDMNDMDEETEKAIVIARTGLNPREADKIIKITRYLRNNSKDKNWFSIRASIMLGHMVKKMNIKIDANNELFSQICRDIYNSAGISSVLSSSERERLSRTIDKAVSFVL